MSDDEEADDADVNILRAKKPKLVDSLGDSDAGEGTEEDEDAGKKPGHVGKRPIPADLSDDEDEDEDEGEVPAKKAKRGGKRPIRADLSDDESSEAETKEMAPPPAKRVAALSDDSDED